ncbi:MAG: hypothetical protein KF768_09545 [Phycisphaeraceae bacterium]|nr:hypothetical protein [Phycisphaeraceae bacterium]
MWSTTDLIETIAAGLAERERALRDEQAVHGLDALDETALHPLIATAIHAAGRPIAREVAYPQSRAGSTRRTAASPILNPTPDPPAEITDPTHDRERTRCDIVILPDGFDHVADPVAGRRTARNLRNEASGSLFEQSAERDAAAAVRDHPPGACSPEDAFWLEVKAVGQYAYVRGVPGPNRTYASQLTRGVVGDLVKLRSDATLLHTASLLVLFCESLPIAEHDIGLLAHRCLDRDLPVWTPEVRSFPIVDRIGNGVCALALFPLRRGGAD